VGHPNKGVAATEGGRKQLPNAFALIVDNGVVAGAYVEAPMKLEVNSAEAILEQL
jgi:peroxiredoxin